jgi:hypothetical protein
MQSQEIDLLIWENMSEDDDWIYEPEQKARPSTPPPQSPFLEVSKSIAELSESFPDFHSNTVLFMEQLGLPKAVAFETLSYLIPLKLSELVKTRLWESVSNSIADTGFYELLNYYLLDFDVFHGKQINNTRNLEKACKDHDLNLLKLIIKKFHGREQLASHFRTNGHGNPMPGRELTEFDIVMIKGLKKAVLSGFLEGVKTIDRWYFGPVNEIVSLALDNKHGDIVEYFFNKGK